MNRANIQIRGLFRRFSELPDNLPHSYYRYYVVCCYAYFAAMAFHLAFIFIFFLISVKSLAILNIGSTAIWVVILWSHLEGRGAASITLAIIEIILHAALCTVFIGWGTGFHYYVLAVPLMIFFAPFPRYRYKVLLSAACSLVYFGLYIQFADNPPVTSLATWLVKALNTFNMLSFCFILSLASFYYSRAANIAERALQTEKEKLEQVTALLKKMFGRYLSNKVMQSFIDNPSTLELGGERRQVTIMMTDLRGFTALSERLEPEKVVLMLNAYFEVMIELVLKYSGTINEIVGDALLVIFGAPQEMPDRAQRAIACSIEMQNAMSHVNAENRSQGLPELEMGIGLNEAEVIVGNIGSSRRSKYSVVGSGVNMTSRIESYSVGGQILISESLRWQAGDILRIDARRQVLPKGAKTPLTIYEVGGISGPYNLALEGVHSNLVALKRQIPVRYSVLEGEDAGDSDIQGTIVHLSNQGAEIDLNAPVDLLANLRIRLEAASDSLSSKDFYGKVIENQQENGHRYLVRFTSVPPEIDAYFESHCEHAMVQER